MRCVTAANCDASFTWVTRTDPHCDPDAIAQLVTAGDGDALERIAACYIGDLLGVGRCACRDPQSAPDAVHDALVSAAEKLDQFRGDGSVKAWLSRMVVNACRCRDRGRKNDPAWNRPLPDEPESEPAVDAPARAELRQHLDRALATLSDSDHALFVASQIDEATAPELGRLFGISADAVRARLKRIRRRLRKALDPVWQEWSAVSAD